MPGLIVRTETVPLHMADVHFVLSREAVTLQAIELIQYRYNLKK